MATKYLALALLCLASSPASAVTIADPVGDWVPSYDGPKNADLDVTSFSVNYDTALSRFLLSAVFAGTINPADPGFYIIGVNTGTGPNNFAAPPINLPGITFNTVIRINKDGTSTVSGVTTTVSGDHFDSIVPLSSLPASTGRAPVDYGFNLWPRGGNPSPTLTQPIADFAPNNGLLAASVPEASTWGMMVLGVGAIAAFMRRRRVSYRFSSAF
jgi:hypothetical protein